MDELEQMVINLFSEVQNKEVEAPIWPVHPFKDEHFSTKWYIIPIKDMRNLDITFPLPDLKQHYRSSVIFLSDFMLCINMLFYIIYMSYLSFKMIYNNII